jgi:uncharacterized protein (TIGR02996 family)
MLLEMGHPDHSSTLAALAKSKASETDETLVALAELPASPELTETLVRWILRPQWPGATAQAGWKRVFARLIELADPRALAPLRAAAAELPAFTGNRHRVWMQAQLAATVSALEKACQGKPVPAEPIAPPRRKAAPSEALRLVERVWARPDDESLRHVVADALQELGDPWGEFIALQLHNEDARAATLLRKHAERFGGPIAHIAGKDGWRFERGFLVEAALTRKMVPRVHWEAAARSPYWATVETVIFDQSIPRWFVPLWAKEAPLGRLRMIVVDRPLTLRVARKGARWRITYDRRTSVNFTVLRALQAGGMIIEGAPER